MSETSLAAAHLAVYDRHDVVGGFKILHDAILELGLLAVAELVRVVLLVHGLLLADLHHLGGHHDLGFHSDSFHVSCFI